MDSIQIPTAKAVLVITLLIATTGLAQAYAVPPPQADLGVASAGLGRLLWIPLVLLIVALGAGLVWSLRAGRIVKPDAGVVRSEAGSTRAATVGRKDALRHKPRRWRLIPAAAH
jgi:hypothetical protein